MIQLIISENFIVETKYYYIIAIFFSHMRGVDFYLCVCLWFISLTFSNSLCAVCNFLYY